MIEFVIDVPCPKCGIMNELSYGYDSGFDSCIDKIPSCNCLQCGEFIEVNMNNKTDLTRRIIET